MADRRRRGGRSASQLLSALALVALASTGCQSDSTATEDGRNAPPAPRGEVSQASGSAAPRLHYEPELDFFYAALEDASGNIELERGYHHLYIHDTVAAHEYFLTASTATPEQRLSRLVGLGRTSLTLSRWFVLVGQLMAEGNLGYFRDVKESASRGLSQPPSEDEAFVAGRSAVYLGRREQAQEILGALSTPQAAAWASVAVGAQQPDLASVPLHAALAGQGPDAALEAIRQLDWKQPTHGRFWDPYQFEVAARAHLAAAHLRFQEAATLGAELSQSLEPAVLDGIRYHLALTCYLTGHDACVSGLGPGQPGTPLAVLAAASARRTAGAKPTLQDLGVGSDDFQAGLLAAQVAEGSSLEERIEMADGAVEAGQAKAKSINPELWPHTAQEAIRIAGALRQLQAGAAADQSEREAYLGAAIDRMREAPAELTADRNEALYVAQLALAYLQRTGCSDLALASGMLHERLKQKHVELAGPIWALGGINAKNCGNDPIIPGDN